MSDAKELKVARFNARKARKQRDATVTNEDFDLWHSVMLEQERILKELLLKTGETK
jgi:hypothetical protein